MLLIPRILTRHRSIIFFSILSNCNAIIIRTAKSIIVRGDLFAKAYFKNLPCEIRKVCNERKCTKLFILT